MAEHVRKFGLVGCGHRGVVGFLGTFRDLGHADSVLALCDTNPTRLAYAHEFLGNPACRTTGNLEELLAIEELDTVIVATPDSRHVDVVPAAFSAGKDVVCEKPMGTTTADCRLMMRAQGEKSFRMAFNFRCNAVAMKTKELLEAGAIGTVLAVEARDIVDWRHGSDYFRRWHRYQAQSGGLQTHKSTHTFDIVNWWLDDVPVTVSAQGARRFYLPGRQQGERCLTCRGKATCPFYVDLNDDIPGQNCGIEGFYRRMYLEAEGHDGYLRDACVFDPVSDICDTYTASVVYRGGALLTYSALFFAPHEDRQFVIYGDRGQLSLSREQRRVTVRTGPGPDAERHVDITPEAGGHDGADMRFVRSLCEDAPAGRSQADAADGYWGVAMGESVSRSIATGQRISVPGPEDEPATSL